MSSPRREGPVRTCLGCGKKAPQAELLRLALVEGRVKPDPERRCSGRGVYICRRSECASRLSRQKSRLAGAFRQPVQETDWDRIFERLDGAEAPEGC